MELGDARKVYDIDSMLNMFTERPRIVPKLEKEIYQLYSSPPRFTNQQTVEHWLKYKKFDIRKFIKEGLIRPKLHKIKESFMGNDGKYYNGQFDTDDVQDGLARVEWRSGDIYEGEVY